MNDSDLYFLNISVKSFLGEGAVTDRCHCMGRNKSWHRELERHCQIIKRGSNLASDLYLYSDCCFSSCVIPEQNKLSPLGFRIKCEQ